MVARHFSTNVAQCLRTPTSDFLSCCCCADGQQVDYDIMQHCCETLDQLGVAYEARVISRTALPDLMFDSRRSGSRAAARHHLPARVRVRMWQGLCGCLTSFRC